MSVCWEPRSDVGIDASRCSEDEGGGDDGGSHKK